MEQTDHTTHRPNTQIDNTGRRWPEGAFVYHIYPRSFKDSNDDGIGDLRGVTQKLDYFESLGVTALWLSPFYPSPMADFGYDVADYCDVDPMFGSLNDFKTLLQGAHDKGLHVMIDLVPNHTSDEHQWFLESKASKEPSDTYRDWYVWRDGIGTTTGTQTGQVLPPNNWRDALTGGSAWEWSAERNQFYLHSFDVRQPDLNWSNPVVREAIKDVMRFWLDLGVDGFRVDAVYWMAKEPLLSDDPVNPDFVVGEDLPYYALRHDNSRGWPAVYAYLSEMAEVLHEPAYAKSQRFMVTEAYPEGHNPLVEYLNFYVGMDPKVAAPFNFEGLGLPWQAHEWRKFLRSFHGALAQIDPHCVPSYAFGNHDQPRISSRIGDAAARSAAVLLMTLPGMVFLYYGDELGMKNVSIPADMVKDPGAKGEATRGDTHPQGRDPQRTPMQWSADAQAGFTNNAQPWLPVSPDYTHHNVEVESTDPDSFLSLYRHLGQLRAQSDSLKYGTIHLIETGQPDALGFIREIDGDTKYLVLINYSDKSIDCDIHHQVAAMLVSSYGLQSGVQLSEPTKLVHLRPHEAVLCAVA